MRFALSQLRKLPMPHTFYEEIDLSSELDGFEDIISSSLCKVTTTIKERGVDTYLCDFNISIDLVVEDSITLEPIDYKVEVESSELFSNEEEDAYPIDGFTLDTKEAIVTTILSNKPMSISNSTFESDIDDSEDDDDKINPAFASLKDLL